MATDSAYQHDKELGYMPAIPLAFVSRWWFGLRKRFICTQCFKSFKTQAQYQSHYVFTHMEASDATE